MLTMSNETTINPNRLDLVLARLVGAKFAGLTTATETRMNKTNGERGKEKRSNPFYKRVLSLRNIKAAFCYDYDGNVERALAKQGKDADEHRKGETWYNAITDDQGRMTAFCEHKQTGEKYIRLRTLHKGETTYIASERIEDGDTVYEPGDTIPFAAIKPYFPKSKPYANQGLDKGTEIAATTLKFASVRGLRVNGERFRVEQPANNDAAEVAAIIAGFLDSMPTVSAEDIPASEAIA
jgi:hypothetical protein